MRSQTNGILRQQPRTTLARSASEGRSFPRLRFGLVCRIVTAGVTTLLLLFGGLAPARGADAPLADGAQFFRSQVQPLLQAHCYTCHGPGKKVKGGLRLTSRAEVLEGGDSGPAVDLAHPERSLILEAVRYDGATKMPPRGKLSKAQIDVLTRWVKQGLPWAPAEAKVARKHGPPPVDDHARNFWSFRPVVRPRVPAVRQTDWVRNPIDAFVLAKLEAAGLPPAAPAANETLLRRLYYDLTGLPPTPAEVAAFRADPSPTAYEKVVDRLLSSPRYGERWARHWLDLVRYAETNSFERDGAKPFVWRYRDYVIRSFNTDKPYDRLIKEQLAGDELDGVTDEGLIATGYYRLGPWDDEPADPLLALYDDLDDIVATTGQVFLGLTVNCARCHDHKFDPFPQKDYYRLLAFFHSIQRFGVRSAETVARASLRPIASREEQRRQLAVVRAYQTEMADLKRRMKVIEDRVRPRLPGGDRDDFEHEGNRLRVLRKHVPDLLTAKEFDAYQALWRWRDKRRKNPPSVLAQALCVTEVGRTPRETFILARGNPRARGERVEPGFPSVLTAASPALPRPRAEAKTSGRRRVLAEWIARPDNPLTTRVMANRLWQYHFGRGIVRSTNNFGYQGTPPTHPELLDWLASEFTARGMRFKELHRLIVTSSTYRMSSRPSPAAQSRDPENDLLSHFDLRRLSAEEVRDSVLAVCGSLNGKMGGESIYPRIPKEVLFGQSYPGWGWDQDCPAEERARRSVYVHVKRSLAVPLLAAFDAADPDGSCPVRFTTTQPAQALAMLNGDFLNAQAAVFARDLLRRAGADPAGQVRLALWRVTQREPTAGEVERGLRFMAALRAEHKQPPEEALRSFCLLALNLNEFLYLD